MVKFEKTGTLFNFCVGTIYAENHENDDLDDKSQVCGTNNDYNFWLQWELMIELVDEER